MHSILVSAFLLIAAAPLWGRWRMRIWLKENMPKEEVISHLTDLDAIHHCTEILSASEEDMVPVGRDRT
jgi:hypothetical protein